MSDTELNIDNLISRLLEGNLILTENLKFSNLKFKINAIFLFIFHSKSLTTWQDRQHDRE